MYFSIDLKFVLDDREMESIDAILVLKYQVEKKINTFKVDSCIIDEKTKPTNII